MAISARYNAPPSCCTWWLNSPRMPVGSAVALLPETLPFIDIFVLAHIANKG